MRPASTPGARSTASMAAVMPPVMSGVQATLALASTRSAGSRMTASVLVPPTSMPRRQSSSGTGKLLHGQVVEVVAECPGTRGLDPSLRPPDRVAAEGDHRDPLAVPDPLGHDRVGGLAVQHRDQVGNGGEHPALLERYQVLVLQFQPDQAAGVLAEALDQHRAADEPARGPPLDVRHLAGHQAEGTDLRHQGIHRAALGAGDRLPDLDRQRHRVPHRRPAGLRHGQRVLRRARCAAELDGGGPLHPLHPMPVTRRKAPISAIRASTGLPSALATACTTLIASDTEFRTVAPRACATVSEYSVEHAAPPNSTAAARSSRSIQSPEMVWNTIRLPRSSVITAGLGEIPARCMVTCGTSGKARPIPSASAIGSPIRAAQLIGSRPFEPPISHAINALTLRLVRVSR